MVAVDPPRTSIDDLYSVRSAILRDGRGGAASEAHLEFADG